MSRWNSREDILFEIDKDKCHKVSRDVRQIKCCLWILQIA
jgi:hypothetical protein